MNRLLLCTLLTCISSISAYAGYDEGLAAFNNRDYATALQEMQPLAEQGDARSQYYLGATFEALRRSAQDYRQAVRWYTKAAEQGDIMGGNACRVYGL